MPEHAPAEEPRRFARITAVGGYRPRRVVGNDEICARVQSSDAWIRRRTGITARRFAQRDETLDVMAAAATGKALAAAGLSAQDVDVLIVASMSYLFQAPPLASRTAALLPGFRGAAFDVHAACAGFCHALETARALVAGGSAEHVVVAGTERMSDIVDPGDRSTAFLFGDGAGAVVVGPSAQPALSPAHWGQTVAVETIAQPAPWSCAPDPETAGAPPDRHLRMRGPEVFRWATGALPGVARRALDLAGVATDDLVAFVPHQANLRIIDSLAATLGLGPDVRIARDVVTAGNTSAASVPLAMDALLAEGGVAGGPALLLGFGSGLSYCAQVVTLP